MIPQQTVASTVTLRGRGLFSGRPCTLTLGPAPAGTGVVFQRTDLPGRPCSRLDLEHLVPLERCTGVAVDGRTVALVEHLLAALAGLGVDNLHVAVDSDELPCLDGSARPYAEALRHAGLVAQAAPARILRLSEPIEVSERDARLIARPAPAVLEMAFTLDYGGRFVGRQTFRARVTGDTFLRDIAPARTYVLRPEIEALLRRGLGGGATAENVVIVEEDGTSPTALRFEDECVRHKVLDLLGDLAGIGARLRAVVEAERSGHRLNLRLARALAEHAARTGG